MPHQEYAYRNTEPAGAHSYLLPAILDVLGPPQGTILDLGCGNGRLSSDLIDRGHEVYGVDASVSGVKFANTLKPGRFHVMEIGRQEVPPALSDKRFTTIISTEVIEHLYDPRGFIALARRILRGAPGRRLILSTPYHGYWKNLALAITGKMDKHFGADWDGGHIKFFSRPVLERLLREQEFEPKRFIGAGRYPYLWSSMVIASEIAPTPADKRSGT